MGERIKWMEKFKTSSLIQSWLITVRLLHRTLIVYEIFKWIYFVFEISFCFSFFVEFPKNLITRSSILTHCSHSTIFQWMYRWRWMHLTRSIKTVNEDKWWGIIIEFSSLAIIRFMKWSCYRSPTGVFHLALSNIFFIIYFWLWLFFGAGTAQLDHRIKKCECHLIHCSRHRGRISIFSHEI